MDALAAGAVVRLKRGHPCGSDLFVITLVGLDIRLSCAGCGAKLILTRSRLQSRLSEVLPMRASDLAGGERGEGGA